MTTKERDQQKPDMTQEGQNQQQVQIDFEPERNHRIAVRLCCTDQAETTPVVFDPFAQLGIGPT